MPSPSGSGSHEARAKPPMRAIVAKKYYLKFFINNNYLVFSVVAFLQEPIPLNDKGNNILQSKKCEYVIFAHICPNYAIILQQIVFMIGQ